VPGMHIAAKETGAWVEASVHPALAGCFGVAQAAQSMAPASAADQEAKAEERTYAARPAAPATPGSLEPLSYASVGPRENMPALISMITGIVAAPLGCVCGCLGVPTAVVAIVTGAIGLHQIKTNPQEYTGKGKALAGLLLGIGAIVLWVAGIIFWLLIRMGQP
jgi:hypothetical protein